jgi:toxin FitB
LRGYLLDTNVVSELRKSKPHGAVVAWLQSVSGAALFLSAVSMAEFQVGLERTRLLDTQKANEIEAWIETVPEKYRVLPMDGDCFREFGRLTKGQTVALIMDSMIAATARVHGLTVVTRNVRDFERFDVSLFNPFHNVT